MFELENKNVLVYGTGKSGIGAAKLLLKAGAVPVLYDGNTELDPEEICKKWARRCASFWESFRQEKWGRWIC